MKSVTFENLKKQNYEKNEKIKKKGLHSGNN